MKRWPRAGRWSVQRPGDAASPRYGASITLPADRVRSLDGAYRLFVHEYGLDVVAPPRFELLEAWQRTNGTQMQVALADTRLGGGPGVAFILAVKQPRDRGQYQMFVIEAPRDTYAAWGGITRMMLMRGEIASMAAVPQAQRDQIATAPLPEQVVFYEAALNRHYASLAGRSGRTGGGGVGQLALTQQMTQLNYNMLFRQNLLRQPR